MKKNSNVLQKLTLLLISFLFSLFSLFAFFEFFPNLPARLHLTFIPYYALKERYIPDPDLVLRIKPFYTYQGVFQGDIHGLFSESSYSPLPYTAQYDPNGFRNNHNGPADIMVLGDSYMEVGLNNNDTFAAHLEKASGLSVANYGMGWYGPFQYLETLKRYHSLHHPKIALFSFFEGNDLKDILYYQQWKKGAAYYHFTPYFGNSIYRFFICLKDSSVAIGKLFLRRWDPRRATLRLKGSAFHTAFVYPIDLRKPDILKHSPEVQALKLIFMDFKRTCEANQIKPVIFFIPSKAHIYLSYATMPGISAQTMEAQKSNRAAVETMVRTLANESGIQWLSAVDLFQKAAEEGQFVYYETDTHWNTQGRRLAAEFVASQLLASKPKI